VGKWGGKMEKGRENEGKMRGKMRDTPPILEMSYPKNFTGFL